MVSRLVPGLGATPGSFVSFQLLLIYYFSRISSSILKKPRFDFDFSPRGWCGVQKPPKYVVQRTGDLHEDSGLTSNMGGSNLEWVGGAWPGDSSEAAEPLFP